MPNATIRPARPDDLPAVEAMLVAADLPLDGVRAAFGDFLVADDAGELVGAIGLEIHGDAALLRSAVVAPAWRGRHLGQSLTAAILGAARERGLDSLWLLTLTAADFFPRFGFRRVERDAVPDALKGTDEFQHACPASAVVQGRRVSPLRVLVVCTANAARSQLAEALLRHRGGDLLHVRSAGARPADAIHPLAVATLAERGIAWDGHAPRGLDAALAESWDLVITVCDGARDVCPVVPGAAMVHWGLPDPAAAPEATRADAFRSTADALERRVDAFLALPLATLRGDALRDAAQQLA